MNMAELESKTLEDLRGQAKELDISGYTKLKKSDLVLKILKTNAESQGLIFGGGVLEIVQDGISIFGPGHLFHQPLGQPGRFLVV